MPEKENTFGDTIQLIFGGGGGIGSALSRKLRASGARLVLVGHTADKLQPLKEELQADVIEADATSFSSVSDVIETVIGRYERLDGVTNCVGSVYLKPAHQTSEEDYRAVLAKNLDSAFAVVRAASKAMQKSGGSVVLMSSAAARCGLASHEAIAAAKAGVIGLTQSAAATYARSKIRVNCVAPGLVQTPMTRNLTANETMLKASKAMHALGEIGEPEDIASAIYWLLDPANKWVTGQVIGVDGGLGTVRPKVAG